MAYKLSDIDAVIYGALLEYKLAKLRTKPDSEEYLEGYYSILLIRALTLVSDAFESRQIDIYDAHRPWHQTPEQKTDFGKFVLERLGVLIDRGIVEESISSISSQYGIFESRRYNPLTAVEIAEKKLKKSQDT